MAGGRLIFRAQANVEWMLDNQADFAEIENYIEELVALPEDLKSALWLYSWAVTRRRDRGHSNDLREPAHGLT
jgi:hypothetical protein